MSFMEKVTAGAERAVKETEKAIDKGKAKIGELQIEMQMDSQAKKLGYIVFDFYRGREVDQAQRQKYLDEMARLEDQLAQARAEAATKKQAAAAAGASAGAAAGSAAGDGPDGAAGAAPEASTPPAPGYPPVPSVEPDCNIPAAGSEAAQQSADQTFKGDGTWPAGDA